MKRAAEACIVTHGRRCIEAAERRRIEGEVRARFAGMLAQAGFIRRRVLRVNMWWTVERELRRVMKRAAPSNGLY